MALSQVWLDEGPGGAARLAGQFFDKLSYQAVEDLANELDDYVAKRKTLADLGANAQDLVRTTMQIADRAGVLDKVYSKADIQTYQKLNTDIDAAWRSINIEPTTLGFLQATSALTRSF